MSPSQDDARGAASAQAGATILGGALVLALVEIVSVLASAPALRGGGERAVFFALELAVGLGAGGAAAVVGALGAWCLVRLGNSGRALALALLAAPGAMYVGHAAFRGPRAQRLPGHPLLEGLVAVAIIGAVYFAARLIAWLGPRRRTVGTRWVLVIAGLLGLVTLQIVDERVLLRLYPFFHRGLELAGLVVASLVVAVMRPRLGRTLAPWLVAGLLAAATLGGTAAVLVGVRRDRAVAAVVLERAPFGGTIARSLLGTRLGRDGARLSGVVAPEPDEARLPPGLELGPRDVVLITIDALRADRLTPAIAPRMAALAERGVRFEQAYTQVPHTSFALATLLTGRDVYARSAAGLDSASRETLAELVRRDSWKTAAFFPPAVFFIDRERLAPFEKSAYGFEYVKYEYLDAQRRTDQIVAYFEHEHPARAMVWAHYFEPHEPYDLQPGYTAGSEGGPPAEVGRPEAQVRYEGEVRRVDAEVGRLLDWLAQHRPGALVVLCADHGEEFGEHGGRYHGTTLFDEQLRVPLVFALVEPGAARIPARRVPAPVGLVDVAPTVLTLLGLPVPRSMRGRDLSPFMGTAPRTEPRGPVFAEIDHQKTVVDEAYKLTCDLEVDRCALYDRAADPDERRDVSEAQPLVHARLRATLDRHVSAGAEASEAGPEVAALFERARVGETAVAPALLLRLAALSPRARSEALQLLAAMPRASGHPTLEGRDDEERALLDLLRARAGDVDARARVMEVLRGAPRPWLGQAFQARLALASDERAAMARLVEVLDDKALVGELADALARTHDPQYRGSLQIALAPVRSRAEVASALGDLGDPAAIEPLLRWVPHDPYVHVRVAMVRAIDRLARATPDRVRVRAELGALLSTEADAPVLRVLAGVVGPGTWGKVELRALSGAITLPQSDGRQRMVLGEAALSDASLPLVDGMVLLPAHALRFTAPAGTWLLQRPSGAEGPL